MEFVEQLGANKKRVDDDPVLLKGKRKEEMEYDGKRREDGVFVDVVFKDNDS